MKSWSLALLVAVLAVPVTLLAQQTGTQQQGTGQPQPLGQGFVLQGQGAQQNQTQQPTETQQQTETPLNGTEQTQAQVESQPLEAPEQEATAPTPEVEGVPQDATGVRLEGLDKITARTFAFEAPLDQVVRFGYLEVTARRCVVAAEEDAPERSAFLEVTEAKPGLAPVKVFSGWMFASSPSVSAMEHPVYDIWVVDCSGYQGEPTATAATGEGTEPEQVEAPVEGVERPLD